MSLKITDLRVGNLIKSISTNKVEEVKEINYFKNKKHGINNVQLKDWTGIHLTGSWFTEFLFEEKKGRFGSEYHKEGVIIYTSAKGTYCFVFDNYSKDIDFVHEIQNLFFALTGREVSV